MNKFIVPKPYSGGLILSFRCNCECKQCMYLGSPKWKDDWISNKNLESLLIKLSIYIKASPYGREHISLNYGLHFTGGEPFLNYENLLKAVKIAHELNIPSLFVETNCYWCKNDEITKERLLELKNNGLHGILISVNPFILEYIPFERTERAIITSLKIFKENLLIYQPHYYFQFKHLNIKEKLSLKKYLNLVSLEELKKQVELLQMGRAVYKLNYLYKNYPIDHFFNENCASELVRGWHNHFGKFGYMPGYCGGLSWGDILDIDTICSDGINLEEYHILKALITGRIKDLYKIAVEDFSYKEISEGYISKCHVCFDIRKTIALKTDYYKELQPKEFYFHI